jgi:NAD(P)-dependent dehydrogenase (short-subunit alcohol dehydrogenase family)
VGDAVAGGVFVRPIPPVLRREKDVARIAETTVAEFGRFDTRGNNAAVSAFGETTRVTIEDLRRVTNLVSWRRGVRSRQSAAGGA